MSVCQVVEEGPLDTLGGRRMREPGRERMSLGGGRVVSDNCGRAILMILLSGLSFSLVAVMVRMAGEVPIYEKVFFRSVVMLAAMGAAAVRSRENPFSRNPRMRLLILRGMFGTTAMFLYFFAIERLTIADATVLNKLSPFFVTLFAVLFLREKLSKYIVPVLIVAFAGAALIVKPEFSLEALPAVGGLLSAAASGAAYTVVRHLRGDEPPYRIVFYFSLVSVVVAVPPMIAHFVMPEGIQWVYLFGGGVFATTGQIALTLGYHQAPATRVSIYVYAHIIFAFLLGLLLWGEMPDVLSIIGTVMIITAAVYNYRKVLADTATSTG
jgi:drug/metabolite transporter (DMT)-like permease